MSRITLTLKAAPALRVDLRGVLPAALAALSVAEIERVGVTHGNQTIALAELFGVALDGEAAADGADELRLVGDCARVDRISWQLAAGRVVVDGAAGDYVGACMSGGEVRVHGHAGVLAACEMAGGRIEIDGDVGDHAASTLP
ncbi:MAG TPA: formylmethanofuran dehydrogenase subunit C, partial [Burkholderiaceae bacterium]|nr:formylmethanofuran dehydrogenase subunit C [Burkholderiaceae bacterium]